MAVYGYGSKAKISSDVISFPTVKGTLAAAVGTSAITLTSGALTGHQEPGPVRVNITATDASKIATWGDSIQLDVYVAVGDTTPVATAAGFRADTYWKVGSYYDLAYSAGAAAISVQKVINFPANRVKVYAYLGAGDSLLTGHGCKVNVDFQDMFPGAKRKSWIERPYTTMYGTAGVTKAFGDSATVGHVAYSPVLNCGFIPSKVYVSIFIQDLSKYGVAVAGKGRFAGRYSLAVETSSDGTNFIHADSCPTHMRPNGVAAGGIFMQSRMLDNFDNQASVYPTTTGQIGKFQSYLRLKFYGDTWCKLVAGHGTRFSMIAFE
jgi:hypothetical protein